MYISIIQIYVSIIQRYVSIIQIYVSIIQIYATHTPAKALELAMREVVKKRNPGRSEIKAGRSMGVTCILDSIYNKKHSN